MTSICLTQNWRQGEKPANDPRSAKCIFPSTYLFHYLCCYMDHLAQNITVHRIKSGHTLYNQKPIQQNLLDRITWPKCSLAVEYCSKMVATLIVHVEFGVSLKRNFIKKTCFRIRNFGEWLDLVQRFF